MTKINCVDTIIETKSLLKHPFYQKWSRGELTLSELGEYAKEYYQLVIRIPKIVEALLSHVTEEKLRQKIEENLSEEKEHIALWEDFALSLGIPRSELIVHESRKETKEALACLENLARESRESGIVTMYSLEMELPKIAATKKEGLAKFYGLTSERAHRYFDEHLKEESHIAAWRNEEVSEAKAKSVAGASIKAQNQILDAVCLSCNIAMC